jgi:hypothetical protein
MGYRSDVCYVVKFFSEDQPEKAFADYLAFQDWVKNKHTLSKEMPDPSTPKNVVKTIKHDYSHEVMNASFFRWSKSETVLVFEAEGIKWYPDYIDIQWHLALLEKVREYETGNFRILRIGEEYNDVEIDECENTFFEMWALIDVNRSYSMSIPNDDFDKEDDDADPNP